MTVTPRYASFWFGSLLLAGCASTPVVPSGVTVPSAPREFRAAWVATVANIDWPSRPGLTTAEQQREALAILDRLVELKMNAVVFQVRPQADALYASELEPWSSYLTGVQGEAPEPLYDPLEFWVAEAHARGLELHTWFNPYRANHPANAGPLSEHSIVRARPELVVQLGDKGYYWMDPALQEVQDHSIAVVLDVVRRYDIDGVHFDDYFYPYRDYNDGEDFPDDASWAAYQAAGGGLSRADWRRAAVDGFIQRLYAEIKSLDPRVEFGISPFGIYRPGQPASIQGFDQYAELYADARRWLVEGWVDYFTPQLYWPIAQVPQSFPVLLGWWAKQNVQGRHLWPGTSIARMQGERGATELVNQVMITRGLIPEDPGLCLFSMKHLQREGGVLGEALSKGPFADQALVPASPWLDDEPPQRPELHVTLGAGSPTLVWAPRGDESPFLWVVTTRRAGSWSHRILPAAEWGLTLAPGESAPDLVALRAVDRCGNASEPAVVELR